MYSEQNQNVEDQIKQNTDMRGRNYLIACTPLLGAWIINTENGNCSFMNINLT